MLPYYRKTALHSMCLFAGIGLLEGCAAPGGIVPPGFGPAGDLLGTLMLAALCIAAGWMLANFHSFRFGWRRRRPEPAAGDKAREILRERFARGEIERDDFCAKLRDLEDSLARNARRGEE